MGRAANKTESFTPLAYALFAAVMLAVFVLCVSVGSVSVPFGETFSLIAGAIRLAAQYRQEISSARSPD